MTFYIGSGQELADKEAFLRKLHLMINDCETNGGTRFDVTVDADENCFFN